MMVPPLSERPVTEEDEERFRRETAPRKYTLRRRWADYRAEVKERRPKGARARARAWLHVEPFYWGMRVVYVVLFAGAVLSVYINGVAEGWWPAWGERPSVAATTSPPLTPAPTPSPSATGEAAMSGGYQIGPDGVLVRPAEHAASTYTKPELPEEAKENTERGAELAAEHYLATLEYAWNTGDTQALSELSDTAVPFNDGYVEAIDGIYSNGWVYGNKASVTGIVSVEPVSMDTWNVQPDTIGVLFRVTTTNGVACTGERIIVSDQEYTVNMTLFMTWKNNRWLLTEGNVPHDNNE